MEHLTTAVHTGFWGGMLSQRGSLSLVRHLDLPNSFDKDGEAAITGHTQHLRGHLQPCGWVGIHYEVARHGRLDPMARVRPRLR